jgi:hypothetical protein
LPAIPLQNIDDYLERVTHKYFDRVNYNDLSVSLRESVFAKCILGRAAHPGDNEMEGDLVHWKLMFAQPQNFKLTAPYAELETKRVDMMTHGQMFWSMNETNYNFCVLEDDFSTTKVRLYDAIEQREHAMYDDYIEGMEKLMFGPGPTSVPVANQPTPPASLLWWLQPYNGNASYPAYNASGSTAPETLSIGPDAKSSGFVGMDPPGFSSVGTGGVFRSTLPSWRNRAGIYTNVTPTDFVDTLIECTEKCRFRPLKSYAQLTPDEDPDFAYLTTYSRIKAVRRNILQPGNDNIAQDIGEYKGQVILRGIPFQEVPAWSDQTLGIALTTGTVLGVNWKTWKYFYKSGLRMQKMPLIVHPTMPDVRVRRMVDSGQIVCLDCRSNFRLDCTAAVTEFN